VQKKTARNGGGTSGAFDTVRTKPWRSLQKLGLQRQTAERRLRILTQRYVLNRSSSGHHANLTRVQSGRQMRRQKFYFEPQISPNSLDVAAGER
jgi:hypothetical protein